ncbi:MAG: alkaline phosphatase family protein, partial [Gaiellaceae bacterium]
MSFIIPSYARGWDEHGGYFEHVPPPQVDAFGLGIRIPTWVISPVREEVAPRAGGLRPHVDAEVPRAPARAANPRVREPPVRHGDAGLRELRG